MFRHILYATDGSSMAERAGDFAASLAIRFHARVTVLYALADFPQAPGAASIEREDSNASEEDAESMTERVVARLMQLGVTEVDSKIVPGQPTSVILGVAESIQPDVLIIGARGSGTWQGALLGSVAAAVVLRAEIPVLVVK
jgi:nucleotide-binding universal stress UspA family protein